MKTQHLIEMKVFVYLRVSSVSQTTGDGFTRQLKACEDYAKSHNMEIAKVYREDHTGTEYLRPQLAELMISLEQNHHGVTTVIVENLTRLARSLMVQEKIIGDFQSKGFNLISTTEGDDLCSDDPTRKLLRTFMGAIAEFDKSMLVAKLRASRDRMRTRTGHCEGRKGYSDTVEGKAIIRHVKALRRRPKFGKQRTLLEVAEYLNQEGIKTMDGHEWSLFRVRDVIN
jgi:DNA invertase Pin-like site-specific DNA recombinase